MTDHTKRMDDAVERYIAESPEVQLAEFAYRWQLAHNRVGGLISFSAERVALVLEPADWVTVESRILQLLKWYERLLAHKGRLRLVKEGR
jgi:hypothetical protein